MRARFDFSMLPANILYGLPIRILTDARSVSLLAADRVNVSGNGLGVIRLQWSAAERRHRTAGLLRMLYPSSDGFEDSIEAAVTP